MHFVSHVHYVEIGQLPTTHRLYVMVRRHLLIEVSDGEVDLRVGYYFVKQFRWKAVCLLIVVMFDKLLTFAVLLEEEEIMSEKDRNSK